MKDKLEIFRKRKIMMIDDNEGIVTERKKEKKGER